MTAEEYLELQNKLMTVQDVINDIDRINSLLGLDLQFHNPGYIGMNSHILDNEPLKELLPRMFQDGGLSKYLTEHNLEELKTSVASYLELRKHKLLKTLDKL